MQTNFLVIGSGISGLNFALHAAKKGHVTIVTKKKIAESNTNYAQGGIAAVIDQTDDFKNHIEDTLKAGAYHNNQKAVKFMVENGPEAITRLIELGVKFERENGKLGSLTCPCKSDNLKDKSCKCRETSITEKSNNPSKKNNRNKSCPLCGHHLKLTREGGHGTYRIAYVGDYTGQEIESILVKRVREHPNIEVLENTVATDLIVKNKTAYGAKIILRNKKIDTVFADAVILATGGTGQVFKYTTNPSIATGDGIAMAKRAGAKLQDMEFIQFHPTALAKRGSPRLLLSETLRGEGAILLNSKEERFMAKYAPERKELASRDIVARAIYAELKNGPVYLSITHKSREFLQKRFPKIYAKLKKYHLDLAKDKIPIVPVAHYTCGGVKTDLRGRTNIKHLYAFGETACTGVHGANRLASNSLLEAVVFSNQVLKDVKAFKKIKIFSLSHEKLDHSNPLTQKAKKIKKQIQGIMWQNCGIIRTQKQLKDGIKLLEKLNKKINAIPTKIINRDLIETKNLLETGLLIIKAALKRKKSLGCHFIK